MKRFHSLNKNEIEVIEKKGTEKPFTGEYDDFFEEGIYLCKKCDAPLYFSSDKFDSGCGWPSFEDEIKGAITKIPDRERTEIICSCCKAHLGHVFEGEHLTKKNVRHCVNSLSLRFINGKNKAILAGGCFWGIEAKMKKAPHVLSTTVGYIGGHVANPTYEEVCEQNTGHLEAVEVIFDPTKTSYEAIISYFLQIHDPTQIGGQGVDLGRQYESAIFYFSLKQKATAEKVIKDDGRKIVTHLLPATYFYKAEDYHQNYYCNSISNQL
jgi:peptide methionine sulfoxide reductase msrA/msrB